MLGRGDEWRPLSLDDVRKVHIQKVLELCQGNRLRAAQILGVGRTSLYCYLKRDGVDRDGADHDGLDRDSAGGNADEGLEQLEARHAGQAK
jgi:hypothetical protein